MTESQLASWLANRDTEEFMAYLKSRAQELGDALLTRNVIPEDLSAYNFQLGCRFALLELSNSKELKTALCDDQEEND